MPDALDVLDHLVDFDLDSKVEIAGPFPILSLSLGSPNNIVNIAFANDISSVIVGHVILIDTPFNFGHHVIKIINTIPTSIHQFSFENGDTVAQGASGVVTIFSFRLGQLNNIIDNQIIPWVEKIIRMSVSVEETVVEHHDGTGQEELALDRKNVNSLVNIENLDTIERIGGPSVNTVEIAAGGILKIKQKSESEFPLHGIWHQGRRNYKITYLSGGPIPDDVNQAVILQASAILLGNTAGADGGALSMSTEGHSESHGAGGRFIQAQTQMTNQARALLNKYMTGIVGD